MGSTLYGTGPQTVFGEAPNWCLCKLSAIRRLPRNRPSLEIALLVAKNRLLMCPFRTAQTVHVRQRFFGSSLDEPSVGLCHEY